MLNSADITTIQIEAVASGRSILAVFVLDSNGEQLDLIFGDPAYEYYFDPENDSVEKMLEAYQRETSPAVVVYRSNGVLYAETAEAATDDHLTPQAWMLDLNYFYQVTPRETETEENTQSGSGIETVASLHQTADEGTIVYLAADYDTQSVATITPAASSGGTVGYSRDLESISGQQGNPYGSISPEPGALAPNVLATAVRVNLANAIEIGDLDADYESFETGWLV